MLDLLKAKKEEVLKEIEHYREKQKAGFDKLTVIDELIEEEKLKITNAVKCEAETEAEVEADVDPIRAEASTCDEAVEQKESTILIRYGNEI